MRIAAVVLVLVCGCKGDASAPVEVPPPPSAAPTAYPLVGKTEAVVPLAKAARPSHVVWIGAKGYELGQIERAWTGAVPATRTPIASLDELVAAIAPPPETIERAKTGVDPWSTPIAEAPALRRGFDRAFAATGMRLEDPTVPLVLAAPTIPAASVVTIVWKLGARLGVVQRGGALAVLRTSFRRVPKDVLPDDERDGWVELHLGPDHIDVLSLPANGRAVVPWTKGALDVAALRAVYRGFGKKAPPLDVFVDDTVPYGHLIETLVALDELGVTMLGLGPSAGPVEARVPRVIALRAERSGYISATAVLEGGRVTAQGDLDKREILRVLRAKFGDFTKCYEPALAKQPDLAGQINIQFFITPNGTVATAWAGGLAVPVTTCVQDAVKAAAFPAPKGGGGVQVNYWVRFRPRDV